MWFVVGEGKFLLPLVSVGKYIRNSTANSRENIKAYFFLMFESDWRPTGSGLSFGRISQR